MGDVGAVASLLSEVFGWMVNPSGLASMKREHQMEIIHAAIKIALDQRDYRAVDLLFNGLRGLSERAEY